MMEHTPGYDEWLRTVPVEIREDPLWRLPAHRLELMLSDCTEEDIRRLRRDRIGHTIGDQLYRCVASISANIAEGYSRRTGPERSTFYEYALGSAREARHWIFQARRLLGPECVGMRLALVTRIIRILTAVVPRERELLLERSPRAPDPE